MSLFGAADPALVAEGNAIASASELLQSGAGPAPRRRVGARLRAGAPARAGAPVTHRPGCAALGGGPCDCAFGLRSTPNRAQRRRAARLETT